MCEHWPGFWALWSSVRNTCHGEAWLEKCFIHFCYNSSCSPRISSPTTYQKGDSLGAQMVKNLPTVRGTWAQSLENSLEKKMATRSSILGWKSPWTEEPGGLQSRGLQRVKLSNSHFHFLLSENIHRAGGLPLCHISSRKVPSGT